MPAIDWWEPLLAGLCFGIVVGFLWALGSYWADPQQRAWRRKECERRRRVQRRVKRVQAIRRQREREEEWAQEAELNRPAWEVNLEAEIENIIRHSELAKRMTQKYATDLKDEELARTVKRVLERERMRLLDPSSKA